MVVGRVKDPDKEKVEEEAEEKKPKKAKVKPKTKELRVVVRLVNTDLDGEKKVLYTIRKIKGISYSMAKAVCNAAHLQNSNL